MSRALVIGDVGPVVHRILHAAGIETADGTDADDAAIAAADMVMCLTEDDRTRLEVRCPSAAGKTFLADSPARFLNRVAGAEPVADAPRLAVVGYNLKFIAPLIAHWGNGGSFQVTVDAWEKFRVHDTAATEAAIDAADIVVCEWCGRNAVVASRRKHPGQRLIVRLHRFELYEPDWQEIDIDAVDAVVAVGDEYRRRIIATTGWPAEKVVVIPNAVDDLQLDRPKLPGARFRIGFVSPATSRKRLDLALDFLAGLRRNDPRYTMSVKGEAPWATKWVSDRPEEVRFFGKVREQLDDPTLRDAVLFEPPGPDVPAWLRTIGWVVSTSEDESFHLGPAEGMASGAVPLIRPWPGADKVYPFEWLLPDTAAMVRRTLEIGATEQSWKTSGARAKTQILDRYQFDDVAARWRALLTG